MFDRELPTQEFLVKVFKAWVIDITDFSLREKAKKGFVINDDSEVVTPECVLPSLVESPDYS